MLNKWKIPCWDASLHLRLGILAPKNCQVRNTYPRRKEFKVICSQHTNHDRSPGQGPTPKQAGQGTWWALEAVDKGADRILEIGGVNKNRSQTSSVCYWGCLIKDPNLCCFCLNLPSWASLPPGNSGRPLPGLCFKVKCKSPGGCSMLGRSKNRFCFH